MRLFIATPVNLLIYQAIKNDFKDIIEGKWVEGWNLHLTHKFIGEDTPEKYKIKLNIKIKSFKITSMALIDEKILYLKADIDDSINREINEKFNLTNDKPFLPHITLCRIKNIKDKEKLKEKIKKWENLEIEAPIEVYLYKSTLTKKGPIYEKIYKY